MEKKRIIKSYDNLAPELKELFKDIYPYGYSNKIVRLTNAKNENFFAVPMETEDIMYMVKVQPEKIKKKTTPEEEFSNVEDDVAGDVDDADDFNDNDMSGSDPSYEPNFDDNMV